MKKYVCLVLIGILCIAGFFGVYYGFSKDDKDDKNQNIVVAEVTHSAFYAPFYVSLHEGYFEEEGLDVEVILTSGADKVASAVLSGDANIGLSGLEATLYVYDNGADDYLVSFSSLTKRDGQFLVGDCSLKDSFTVNDLKGKSVLAGRAGGMPSMVFEYALYKNGIEKGEVTVDNSVDFASLSGAYIGKQGDFVNLFEPTALALEKENYGCVLASLGLMSGEVPYTVFHTKKSYIKNNKDVVEKFTNAIGKGLKFVKENDSEKIAKVIKSEFPDISLEDLSKVVIRYKEADSWWDTTYIKEDAYNNLLDLMEYNDALNERIDFNKIVDNSFNE